MYNIFFFGSSDYCLPVVESLHKNFNLLGVVTKSQISPVGKYAAKKKLRIFAPINKQELENLIDKFKQLRVDLFVVADFGMIIPESIFTLPKFQSVNIHFSHLPEFRGPSPVQNSILQGKKYASVSIIKLAVSLDSGDIIKIIDYNDISPEKETAKSLYEKLFSNISNELPQIINDYLSGKITPALQDQTNPTFTKILTKESGFIDISFLKNLNTAEDFKILERKIRAYSPWPGVWTRLANGKRLKILKAHLESQNIIFDLVQLEGKNPVTWKQFLEGYPDLMSVFRQPHPKP